MSTRTARPSVVRAAVLAAFLAGCSTDVAVEEPAGVSVEEFCDISEISAIEDTGDNAYALEVAEAVRNTGAPDEIADDWEVYTTGLSAFTDAVKGLETPGAAADDAYFAARKAMMSKEFTEATALVEAFHDENCME